MNADRKLIDAAEGLPKVVAFECKKDERLFGRYMDTLLNTPARTSAGICSKISALQTLDYNADGITRGLCKDILKLFRK